MTPADCPAFPAPTLVYAQDQAGSYIDHLAGWFAEAQTALNQVAVQPNQIRTCVQQRARLVDTLLVALWDYFELNTQANLALIAVGGYGRGELLPCSDIDLMVLSQGPLSPEQEKAIGSFSASLWDIGLSPAISVRTLEECSIAVEELTAATSLVEARLLTGNPVLKWVPKRLVSDYWTDADFFRHKMLEQVKRHAAHNYTEYNLEPDIKNAPGGLRDINQIGWITKQHFQVSRFYDLVQLGFLSENEFEALEAAEDFLWLIRHHLHQLTGRNENRLLFDYQRELATRMGYLPAEGNLNACVEEFMRDYYRVAMQVSTLNEMLLDYFKETIIEPQLPDNERPQLVYLNDRFKLIGDKIAVRDHRLFSRNPQAVFELFALINRYPEITGIRARTIRLLMVAGLKINDDFRGDPVNRQTFIQLFKQPDRLFYVLSLMKRYGILGRYLPALGQVIGLMQYDLFHIYTVDAHTLYLIRNLGAFSDPEAAHEFPVSSTVYQNLDKKELVLIAALFHDLAKGRGGDHSELGAAEAMQFCLDHGLTQREANIVAWLIKNHLLMSLTAQKRDISDPDVVLEFARTVGDLVHLDNLYTLTVVDINATNPKLWNTWRASLLRSLYTQTRRVLRAGLDTPIDRQAWIEDTKQQALREMGPRYSREQADSIWQTLGEDYFLRERPAEVAWHTKALLTHDASAGPLILIKERRAMMYDAAQIFIYSKDRPNLFASIVTLLDQLDLDVQDAKVITASTGFSLDTYIVLDRHNTLLTDTSRQHEVIQTLFDALSHSRPPQRVRRRMRRELRHFQVQNEIHIHPHPQQHQTVVEVMSLDRPGLLAQIGELFMETGIRVHSARIATLGERAEDVFFITRPNGLPLTPAEEVALKLQLQDALALEH